MKLLHIIATMDPASGGPCQGIRNTNPELMHSGISREVVSLDAPDSPFLGMDEFTIHTLGPAVGKWQYSAKLLPWLLANMGRFDVVVINGLWLYPSYAGWNAKRILERQKKATNGTDSLPKVYIMPHGMLDPYFQRAPDRKLKAIRNWFYWKFIESRVVNQADGIFFTCQTELELAREAFRPYHPKIEINVGYGVIKPPAYQQVMKDEFMAKCPGLADQPFILFLSRLHRKKGVNLLITAFADIVRDALANNQAIYKMVIAGPGLDSPYGKQLQQLIKSYPLIKEHVFLPGMITGNAKWGALYSSAAFVLPSHQENFGIAVVEAMACGKAVLLSRQVNIWKEIANGGGGIVGDDTGYGTRQMLDSWLRLSDADKINMGKNALKVYQNNFDIALVAKHFIKALFEDHSLQTYDDAV